MNIIPGLVYGATFDPVTLLGGTEVNFTLDQKPWGKRSRSVGGWEKASSGVGESWTQYRDKLLLWNPKVTEAELLVLETWIDWCHDHSGGPFLFRHDISQPRSAGTLSYLESPMQGTDFEPARGAYFGTWEPAIVLRREDGANWDISYF